MSTPSCIVDTHPHPVASSTQNPGRIANWKKGLAEILYQARVLLFALKHPDVPWLAKAAAGCAAAYLLSPIQLIPTFIPVIGQMDDLAALYLGTKALRKLTPPAILAECESQARKS
jgi:uncharacterized membrane protein YkvA (DUF1232 family)